MVLRILKLDFDPGINVDQLFDAYDVIIIKNHDKYNDVSEIMKKQNYSRWYSIIDSLYYVHAYINDKLVVYTNNSHFEHSYFFNRTKFMFDPNDVSRFTFFKGKLPCIFIDYSGEIDYLGEYYKISKIEGFDIYYMEEKGLMTKSAINKQ